MSANREYTEALREFDAVLEHLKAISYALVGKTPSQMQVSYCEQALVKLITHCITLRRLCPRLDSSGIGELWDLPSLSAVARCVIEAHDAFFYLADTDLPADELRFRQTLWHLHALDRRIGVAESIGSTDPRLADIERQAKDLRLSLQESRFFDGLTKKNQQKIRRGDAPHTTLNHKEACERFGVNFDYYNATTISLSQYVHTFPFAIHQLMGFRAGTDEAIRLMKLPINYSLGFMSRVAIRSLEAFEFPTPEPPSRTRRTLQKWRAISQRGLKSPLINHDALASA